MPIPIGILAVAGAASPEASSFVLLASTELTNGTTTSVVFDNIPSTPYQHLFIRSSAATNGTAGAGVTMTFNDIATSVYNTVYAGSYGTSNNEYSAVAYDGGNFTGSLGNIALVDAETTNTFTETELWIPNYAVDTIGKSWTSWSAPAFDGTSWRGGLGGGGFETAIAISKISFASTTAFATGSRFELYGVE